MPYQKDPRARSRKKDGPIIRNDRDSSWEKSGPIQREDDTQQKGKRELEELKERARRAEEKRERTPFSIENLLSGGWKEYIRIEYQVQTSLSPSEVMERISSIVGESKSAKWFTMSASGKKHKTYVGTVDESTFDFIKKGRKSNDIQPATRGSFEGNDQGTLIKVLHEYENATLLQFGAILVIGLFFILVNGLLRDAGIFAFVIIPVAILIMAVIGKFNLQQEQIKFVKLVNGTVKDVHEH